MEDQRIIKEGAPELTASSSVAEEERVDGERDSDFSQSQDGAKWLKLDDGSSASAATAPVTRMTSLGGITRSTQHRKLRGESTDCFHLSDT
ncbi:hypothetical protein CesoFtcFv8_009876 [Champsocephalus esox]|uniref:Uncharacterized protein n=1 Tax=Champsocephalus esox TaxID=159716 RepID=A0AAN8C6Y3_9TELE|nr:hypothetical protein CesoFtcFv8_009876 [Champsocephalus esox]